MARLLFNVIHVLEDITKLKFHPEPAAAETRCSWCAGEAAPPGHEYTIVVKPDGYVGGRSHFPNVTVTIETNNRRLNEWNLPSTMYYEVQAADGSWCGSFKATWWRLRADLIKAYFDNGNWE